MTSHHDAIVLGSLHVSGSWEMWHDTKWGHSITTTAIAVIWGHAPWLSQTQSSSHSHAPSQQTAVVVLYMSLYQQLHLPRFSVKAACHFFHNCRPWLQVHEERRDRL
jgi:hypothetical protein